MKPHPTALVLAAALAAASLPAAAKFDMDAIATYYRTPDPQLKRGLRITDQTMADPISEQASVRVNLSVWAAYILAKQPQQTMDWCAALQKHSAAKIAPVFKMADTPDSGRCLAQLKLSGKDRASVGRIPTAAELLAGPITPVSLDGRWAAFYATGKAQYVEEIAAYVADNAGMLQEKSKRSGKSTAEIATFGSARWSLVSNMEQYPEIRRIVEKYAATLPAAKRKALEKELAD